MSQRNILIASIILNVALLVFFFMQKSQTREVIDKFKYREAQTIDIVSNNNVLWSIIDSIWKSSDKSKNFVKELLAGQQMLPRCNGKKCTEEEESRLKTLPAVDSISVSDSITIGWGNKDSIKYSFKVIYDKEGNFVTINANDLLGKTEE
jgi:hypothetical protein